MRPVYIVLAIIVFSISMFGQDNKTLGFVNANVINSLTNEPVTEEIVAELLNEHGEVISKSIATKQLKITRFGFPMYSYGQFKIRLSHEDYDTTYFEFKYNKRKPILSLGSIAIRKLTRAEKGVKLGEITVTATKLKFYNKGDTIVYNADAFELSSGSMLDGLVSQLPGAELSDDGRIYVNGRFVENILLNGKDFFRGDNKIMLENLPAYMIKDVEVYEKWSLASELAKKRIDEGTYTMDVKLKKEHSIGWLANAEAGGGTKERYMGRAFGLRFSPTSRFSLFGNINNINDTRKPGRNGDWSPSDLTNGLATTKNAGVDYGLFDKNTTYDINGNVQASYTDGLYDARTSSQNFVSSGDTYERLWNTSKNKNLSLSTQHTALYRFGVGDYQRSNINASISANYIKSDNTAESASALFNQEPIDYKSLRDSIDSNRLFTQPWVNSSTKNRLSKNRQFSTDGSFGLYYMFPSSNDALSITADGNYSHKKSEMTEEYMLRFKSIPEEFERRKNKTPSNSYKYSTELSYIYNPNRTLSIITRYKFSQRFNNSSDEWNTLPDNPRWMGTLILPSLRQAEQSAFDIENSYNLGVQTLSHTPSLELHKNISWLPENIYWERRISIHLYLQASYQTDRINFNGIRQINRNRYSWLPNPALWIEYSHSGQSYFSLTYNTYTEVPASLNLIDVEFTSDPFNIRIGNPNLRDTYHHKMEFRYKAGQWASQKEIVLNANIGISIWRDGVSMGYNYDPILGIRYYKPENINGNWWGWLHSTFNIPLTHNKKLRLGTSTRIDISDNADIIGVEPNYNPTKQIVHNKQFAENITLNYSFNRFKIGMLGKVNYRHSTSSAPNFQTINAVEFRYGLTGLVKMPLDIELSTDLTMYSRRGYSNPSMNTDDLVWNASLSKSVMNNNLTFSIDAFDILHRLSNIRYELNGMGRTETWVNCIPRYLMVKARYRLNIQPRKRSAN